MSNLEAIRVGHDLKCDRCNFVHTKALSLVDGKSEHEHHMLDAK